MPVEFEDDLGDALRRTADTFRPDNPGELVGAGHLRGRRLRRRRTVTVVAGAAAFAAVAVGGVLAGGLAQSGGHGSGVAAAPERPKPTPPAQYPAARPVSGKKVASIFAALLPSGTVTGLEGKGPQDFGFSFASAMAVFDDGRGPAEVLIGLQRQGNGIDDCPSVALNPGTWCSITHVHGGTLKIFKGYEYPDRRTDVKDWTATFVTPDGAEVELSQWNSSSEKDAPITRPNPPLDIAEMTAMVTSADWRPVLAVLHEPAEYSGHGGKPGAQGLPEADKKAGTVKAEAAAGND